jgi:hypothetical protein
LANSRSTILVLLLLMLIDYGIFCIILLWILWDLIKKVVCLADVELFTNYANCNYQFGLCYLMYDTIFTLIKSVYRLMCYRQNKKHHINVFVRNLPVENDQAIQAMAVNQCRGRLHLLQPIYGR